MANEEHLAILRQGVEAWNAWRIENPFIRLDLSGAYLGRALLSRADLSKADLRGANLREADLREADLSKADLSWAYIGEADLSGADLRGADLGDADISRADLRGADLRQALLSRADLRGANLSKADLSWAYLGRARLSGASLHSANLSRADLRGTDLGRVLLSGALLREAALNAAVIADLDLSNVQDLETVIHRGPSHISVDTLVRSMGKIPEVFLRGCGVPDSMIEYLPAILGAMEPVQFYSCFISYSTKDQEFAQRLYERMQSHHLRVWFAPEELKAGRKIHEEIDQAIRVYDKLIVVLSEHSLASEWVKTEIYNARQAEIRQQKRKLFPIRLVDMDAIKAWRFFDADTGKDLGREIREYFLPDFTNWKDHDSFEPEFKRLLDALKAEA